MSWAFLPAIILCSVVKATPTVGDLLYQMALDSDVILKLNGLGPKAMTEIETGLAEFLANVPAVEEAIEIDEELLSLVLEPSSETENTPTETVEASVEETPLSAETAVETAVETVVTPEQPEEDADIEDWTAAITDDSIPIPDKAEDEDEESKEKRRKKRFVEMEYDPDRDVMLVKRKRKRSGGEGWEDNEWDILAHGTSKTTPPQTCPPTYLCWVSAGAI